MARKALFAGEINVDLVLQGYTSFPVPGKEVLVQDFAMVLGSATAIMAMGLARLGTPVAFVGRVGDDVWGRYCLEDMASRGIDLSRVIRGGGLKTGVTVSISDRQDRALVTYLGAISALTGADVPDASLAGVDHLHASSFYFQEGLRPDLPQLFARARRAGLTTSLDTGFDPSGRWDGGLRETLRETDLFFPNEVELAALTGAEDPAEGLRRLENGHTRVVAKLGREGRHDAGGRTGGPHAGLPCRDRRHHRRGRLLQRRLPSPLAAGRAAPAVSPAGRRLRRAQHAGARRYPGAADARRGRGAHQQARAMKAAGPRCVARTRAAWVAIPIALLELLLVRNTAQSGRGVLKVI